LVETRSADASELWNCARTFVSGGRDGGGGASNGGEVDACLVRVNREALMAYDHRRVLTVLESAFADLSSGSAVFLGSDTAASGEFGLVSGCF